MRNPILPNPIMFGLKQPQIRLRIEHGIQYAYSISNHNLYVQQSEELLVHAGEFPGVDEDVFATDLSRDGTYELRVMASPSGVKTYPGPGATPQFAIDEGLVLPRCMEPRGICPMLLEGSEERNYMGGPSDGPMLKISRVTLRETPDLSLCPLFSALLECCTTPAEKKFCEAYYTWAVCGANRIKGRFTYGNLRRRHGKWIGEWTDRQVREGSRGHKIEEYLVQEHISLGLTAPVLLPQVWFNYTYDPAVPRSGESLALKGMPKRVDFLFVFKGKMHVVEIDDPSHYARYDRNKGSYEVDEKRYTENLRVERALRAQGIEIHRLSNWEVLEATESELIGMIPSVLGIPLTLAE